MHTIWSDRNKQNQQRVGRNPSNPFKSSNPITITWIGSLFYWHNISKKTHQTSMCHQSHSSASESDFSLPSLASMRNCKSPNLGDLVVICKSLSGHPKTKPSKSDEDISWRGFENHHPPNKTILEYMFMDDNLNPDVFFACSYNPFALKAFSHSHQQTLSIPNSRPMLSAWAAWVGPKREISSSNHQFSGANLLFSFRAGITVSSYQLEFF